MEERDELAGRTVGEFVLRERIGEGGFGAVYRCEQPLLGREAVIKVLHRRLRSNDVVLQRFMREAQLASQLDHPYAAHIYAFGVEKDDGLFWIAMEMVRGTTLARWLRDRGPLPVDRLVPLFERISEVVQTAHERGIVHRDLKPSNIMVIERAGRLLPKLLDFGIAKFLDDEILPAATAPTDPSAHGTMTNTPDPLAATRAPALKSATVLARPQPVPQRPSEVDTMPPVKVESISAVPAVRLTHDGATMGSPPYMPPEQWKNDGVGPASDIYALGVIAYEALAGRRPFVAQTMAGYAELHGSGEVPALGEGFGDSLDRFFRRALAKQPADRPATALELAAAFRVASGLADAPETLPRLDDAVRDTWLAAAPQPLAEAVAALDASRNAHQARDAVRDLFRGLLRYLLALALAARAQVRDENDDRALTELVRALRRRDLVDDERARLLRLLVRPFSSRRGAHPLPELVDLFGSDAREDGAGDVQDPFLELSTSGDGAVGEELVRAQLTRMVSQLSRLLRAASFVLDYTLIVARDGVAERWTGLRRKHRALTTVHEAALVDHHAMLIDRQGRPALLAWPLVQVLAPVAGGDLELFVFDGRGRHGARLVSSPSGFEHHDPAVWDWLATNVVGDPELETTAGASDRAPFLGLASFGEADADRFVGREREVETLTNCLRARALQIVVGASGAGKSSFVHAGVLPALAAGWRAVTMRPGASPLTVLASRLIAAGISSADLRPVLETSPAAAAALVSHAAGDGVIVVVIDQLEELFTLCPSSTERHAFAAVLAKLASSADAPIRVICTVRDDFLMDVEALAPLRSLVSPSLFLLGNPSREDLERTIVEPARRAGYELSDSDLAREMVDAVADRPGALALLSFTASRLWELRDRTFRQLRRNAYEAMGGIGGALGRHAESTLEALSVDEQRVAREAFRHLVTADETRAVLSASELRERLASSRSDAVIEKLVGARLVAVVDVEGESQIEIAHEALISAWPRLQQWVREDADGARMRDQLRAAARQWHERERPRGLLWRDEILAELARWRRRPGTTLSDTETSFADASEKEARRSRTVRRGVAIGAFAILAVAVVVLVELNSEARDQRSLAENVAREQSERIVAQLEEQGRRFLLSGEPGKALVYLVEAKRRGANGRGLDIMIEQAAQPVRAQVMSLDGHRDRVRWGEYSPDGTMIVTASDDGTARLWDAATGKLKGELLGSTKPVWTAHFDPAGRRIAVPSWDGKVRIYGIDTRLLATLDGPGDPIASAVWSPDGTRVAGQGLEATFLWTLVEGTKPRLFGHAPYAMVFSPDSETIAIAEEDATELVDLRTGLVRKLVGHADSLQAVVFSHDGKLLVTTSLDSTGIVWDVATGTKHEALVGHTGSVSAAAFSTDDSLVVTASRDRTARVWTIASRTSCALEGHAGGVDRVAFDVEGTRVVTASSDGTARVWDAHTCAALTTLAGHRGAVESAAFSVDGRRVLTTGTDGTAKLWSADSAPLVAILRGHRDEVPGASLSPDARRVATYSADKTIRIWEIETGKLVRILEGHRAGIVSAQWTGRGHIVTSGRDGTARIWDANSGELLRTINVGGSDDVVGRVAESPDGKLIATAAIGHGLQLWEAATGHMLDRGSGPTHSEVTALEFDRLGDRILCTGVEGSARLYDREGRELRSLPVVGRVFEASFDPSGTLVVTSEDHRAAIWEASSGALVAELPHGGFVHSARFDAGGARVVTASEDGSAKVWDLRGHAISTLEGHRSVVFAAEFSPDGQLVATAGYDRTVRLWEAESGRELATFTGHRVGVYDVRFAKRIRVISIGMDQTEMVWNISATTATQGTLAQLACRLPFRLVGERLEPSTGPCP